MSDRKTDHAESLPPCVLFEDDHLLVVDKPPGLNTHAPDPFAGEGLHEWLKHREPRWASLAILHRLDKGTSGVMAFAKTPAANRSLTAQFTEHRIRKSYLLLTDHPAAERFFHIRSCIVRAGSKYRNFPEGYNDAVAETRFTVEGRNLNAGDASIGLLPKHATLIRAEPVTGRTHQIRVHAAELGFPILGDTLYGGTRFARVCLHAARLELDHPDTSLRMQFESSADFVRDPSAVLRAALIDPRTTTAWRVIHGAADGWPHWFVDRLGEHGLSQSERAPTPQQRRHLKQWSAASSNHAETQPPPCRSLYHKTLRQDVRGAPPEEASPELLWGEPAAPTFTITENGLHYQLSFQEGHSVGLFLDQRDNRRRLLANHVAAGFRPFPRDPAECAVLNAFAYTCAFSVCAARAGANTTSLDLSRKYLDWGRRNFTLNGLDPDDHDFIYGDVFNWLPRLARKGRRFDVILLDPPTFSKSKQSGVFRADKDYGKLIQAVLPMLNSGGTLFASSNTAKLEPRVFLGMCRSAVAKSDRKIAKLHYAPQPPDFPVTRAEPAYLKTVWMKVR